MPLSALPSHGRSDSGLGNTPVPGAAIDVAKWGRHEVSVTDGGYGSDNPHEIAWEAEFTHQGSGATLTIPGFYDGSDTFRLLFMPTRTGTWDYVTASPGTLPTYTGQPSFAALDGLSGSVEVGSGTNGGILEAAGASGVLAKKWTLRDGDDIIPVGLRTKAFMEPVTQAEFDAAAQVLADNNVHFLETRYMDEDGAYESGRNDYVFSGSYTNRQFDLTVWGRWEDRMKALFDRGLGAHMMFYADQNGAPGWAAQSDTELLVIRYAVARCASFPLVMWNTGIDIAEYRTAADIDWFGAQLDAYDAYGHPKSSRRGIGGAGTFPEENFHSYNAPNTALITGTDPDLTSRWSNATLPVSMDDAYGENRGSHPSKDHTAADIRRAAWKHVVVGGEGFLIRGGADGMPLDESGATITGFYSLGDNGGTPYLETDWESEQWLSLVNPFIRDQLGSAWPDMENDQTLVSGTEMFACADPSRTKILYFTVGANDTYDANAGGDLTLDLSGEAAGDSWAAEWHDPRDMSTSTPTGSPFSGGTTHTVTPPTTDDWLLFLTKQ